MTDRNRMMAMILIMITSLAVVTGATIWFLYRAAFDSIADGLVETAQSQARLVEAIAREETTHFEMYGDAFDDVVLNQLIDAHHEYKGFGRTGEFAAARREGDRIVFVLGHRHARVEHPDPVPVDSALAEPMRRALRGESGTMVGLDYAGETVLAAYEPVRELGLGIVAKIDLTEVRAPFLSAGLIALGFSLLVAVAGGLLLVRISNPLVTRLQERTVQLETTIAALEESEERFRTTYELAGVGIAQVALDGRFLDVNQRLCEMTGYSADELEGLPFGDITHPDDLDADLEYARQLLAGEIDRYSMEKRYNRKDGSIIWVRLTGSIVRDEVGDAQNFIAVIEDITARRDAEFAIKSSLEEKDVLLREIHHRVKNNLQVISSLLSLQSGSIDDPRLHQLFQESQSRVRAMALIHEILYDSSDLSSIELRPYISRLVTSLARMYGADTGRIGFDVEAEDLQLSIDEMVPCGLAINELISNSLKYGFPDNRKGRIAIRVYANSDGGVVFVVRDDGVGVAPDLDIRNTGSMGLGLVVGLIEKQLKGHLELERGDGTCFTIVLPPQRARA
ncbi:MAG TPA: PAS domain S-box protein [Candidatus Sulfomarinibacteraceae bacterium]|nr:PAS domain S-box protein [Candidatus Sulfomarinibacteraceae bacterium]